MEYVYRTDGGSPTVFAPDNAAFPINRLFGMNSGEGRCGCSIKASGLVALNTSLGNVVWRDFQPAGFDFRSDSACLAYQLYDSRLRFESHWSFCGQTGIWSRRDRLINTSGNDIAVFRCLSRFMFSPGHFEVYSQYGPGKMESQGGWQALRRGSFVFDSEGGYTCLGSTPFICLREAGNCGGIAFHMVPQGSWRIVVHPYPTTSKEPLAVVDAGLSDENLNLALKAGCSLDLPEILVQTLPGGEPHTAMPALHRYLNTRLGSQRELPVVYNTWGDFWDALDMDRMRKQLKAARQAGCETFVIDAGWFGGGYGDWSRQVGDWREKPDVFHGRLVEFAEEVRENGMGFGLWVEPERIGADAPILAEHPEWFIPSTNGYFYPRLACEPVRLYILGELRRLIETYRLVWMKVDFNMELGIDPDSSEYYAYYDAWNRLFGELRQLHPEVFLEGCAGGGKRLDITNMQAFDCYWMSDNNNPHDMLCIYQHTILRVSPGRLTKWITLRPAGSAYPKVSCPTEALPPSVVTWTSTGRPWEGYVAVDLDFAARSAMTGALGVSGDLAGLSERDRERVGQHIAFYKKWRWLINRSVAYLSAPPLDFWNYEGWTSVQLQDPESTTSLLFVYRLESPCAEKRFLLQGLDLDGMYAVTDADAPEERQLLTGRQLMEDGVTVRMDRKHGARVLSVARE